MDFKRSKPRQDLIRTSQRSRSVQTFQKVRFPSEQTRRFFIPKVDHAEFKGILKRTRERQCSSDSVK